MEYRFNRDADSGLAHCEQHNVSEREVIDVLQRPVEKFRRRDGTLVANGQTMAGRYLRVIFREYSEEDYIFVITAYDLTGKAKQAYRRRHRRR
jgi:hypothetical protein